MTKIVTESLRATKVAIFVLFGKNMKNMGLAIHDSSVAHETILENFVKKQQHPNFNSGSLFDCEDQQFSPFRDDFLANQHFVKLDLMTRQFCSLIRYVIGLFTGIRKIDKNDA